MKEFGRGRLLLRLALTKKSLAGVLFCWTFLRGCPAPSGCLLLRLVLTKEFGRGRLLLRLALTIDFGRNFILLDVFARVSGS